MAGRNRMNFESDHVQYQGYPYGDAVRQQLGPSRETGLDRRDSSSMRRGLDVDPLLSRRLPGPALPSVVDHRAVTGRLLQGCLRAGRLVSEGGGVPFHVTKPPIHPSQQNFNAGVNQPPYEQGGFLGAGSYNPHCLPFVRGSGVGGHSYSNVDSCGLLQQQQVQLADGSMQTMYSVPELGGNLAIEAGLKSVGAFRGGYVGPDALAAAPAQSQELPQHGLYQGRHVGRDGRQLHGWQEDPPLAGPRSQRTMPMSPRRDELVRMMSPRRDNLTPPTMSPRRDDLSPPLSPRRRDYPPVLDYGGRLLQPRRGFSSPRAEDFLMSPRVDCPMSPRDGVWDYDGSLGRPPRRPTMSPSPSKRPTYGRSRQSAKPPSQWDVLPPERFTAWDNESERPGRRDSRRDYTRGGERNIGYGVDIDDPKRWPSSQGRYDWGGDYESLRYTGERRSYDDHPPPRVGMVNSRPNPYSSVVNQRVGLVTKYIERERAERAGKESARKISKDKSRKRPVDDDRLPADSSRPARSDRRHEQDSLAAAIAKTTASLSKHLSGSEISSSKHEKSSVGPVASWTKSAAPVSNADRTAGGEKAIGSKPSPATVPHTSAAANGNGNAAGGSSGRPSAILEVPKDFITKETNDSKTPVADKAGIEEVLSKNTAGDNGGLPNNSANGNKNADSKSGGEQNREPAPKRPSLVMEIERATKSRKLADQQKHVQTREMEETYYDASELSADFVTRMSKAASRYSLMISDDPSFKRSYEGGGGGQGGLHCLVCGKGSKTYSDIYELITHAQHSQVQSKRIDHMGFRKALIDLLKLDIRESPVINTEADEDPIVWPPVVVVENTRTAMGADRRWEGVTNSEMALILNELGHLHGRAKSIWDKFGHRGIVHVEFEPTLEGLQEAERLHNYFLQNGRGRVQWDTIRPFKTGLPGFETVPEGADFTRLDEVTMITRRVLYGYLALKKDVEKIFSKKQRKKVQVTNRKEVKAKLLASQSGEHVEV